MFLVRNCACTCRRVGFSELLGRFVGCVDEFHCGIVSKGCNEDKTPVN